MNQGQIENLRILLIEDESLVALVMEEVLGDLNCTVVSRARTVTEAMMKASSDDFDVAILDVNLNGVLVFPVAELLLQRGIPFIFATGYGLGGIPDNLRVVPVVAKPFSETDVERALNSVLARAAKN